MTMTLLSSTDVAISLAAKNGTLQVSLHTSRFGSSYYAISDDVGLIEVANSAAECEYRVGGHFGRYMVDARRTNLDDMPTIEDSFGCDPWDDKNFGKHAASRE